MTDLGKNKINMFSWLSLFLISFTLGAFFLLKADLTTAQAVVVSGSSPLTASTDATVTVAEACTLTANVDTAHTATIPNGTYKSDGIGQTTLKVLCNDPSGYAIYAVGFTGEKIGDTNSTKLVGAGTGQLISTGVYSSGDTTSSWAMKLIATGSLYVPTIENGFSNFSAVPINYTKVASYNSFTDAGNNANGSKLTTTYAAFISGTQAADTYNGKVKYTLVHPASNIPNEPKTCAASKICYWPNAGNQVNDKMGDENLAASTTLWASNFQRPGYGFVGWSDAYDYVANVGSESNPNAHIYGPNETISLTTSDYTTNGLSLYAVWVKSAGNLQGWTCPNNTTMPIGTVTALTDVRDNDTYAVAKLADGKCWMIENLRLDYDASITTANTQSNNGAFGGVFSGLARPETANFSDLTTANSLYYSGTQGGTASVDIGTDNHPGGRFPRYNNNNTNSNSTINPNTTVANMTSPSQNVYSYGNYYSWHAAIADTSWYHTGNQSITSTSICPAGWRLPRGGDKDNTINSDFWDFVVVNLNEGVVPNNYDEDSAPSYAVPRGDEVDLLDKLIRKYPNNFVCSGRFSGSSISHPTNVCSRYWSSTSTSAGNNWAYVFTHSNTQIFPGTYEVSDYHGLSIRCLVGS